MLRSPRSRWARGVGLDVEAVPREADHRVGRCRPATTGRPSRPRPRWSAPCRRPTSSCSGSGRGRSTSCRSRPASAPSARAGPGAPHRPGPRRRGSRFSVNLSACPLSAATRRASSRGAVVGVVVHQQHVVDGAQQRRQHEAQAGRLVAAPAARRWRRGAARRGGARATRCRSRSGPRGCSGPDRSRSGSLVVPGPAQRPADALAHRRRDLGAHVVRHQVGERALGMGVVLRRPPRAWASRAATTEDLLMASDSS